MGADIVAEKYSTAIFELAQENNILVQMEDDLAYVRSVFNEHPNLGHLLQNPALEEDDRCKLLQKIFGEGINKLGLQLLLVMVKRNRSRYILPTITEYISRSRAARNILEVKVTVAKPLTDAEEVKLRQKIESITDKEVSFDIVEDPGILGGLVIQIGDKRIDASVNRNLQELGKALLKAGSTKNGVNE